MKVVLVAIHPYPSPQAVSLGNAFLKASLDADPELAGKITVTLADFFVGAKLAEVLSAILAERPAAVGFSVFLWNRRVCHHLARLLRKARPELTIFAGGPEPTADPEGMLQSRTFNFLVLGEGETAFPAAMAAILSGRGAAGTKGIATLQEGQLAGSRSDTAGPLDTIPSPYLTGVLDPSPDGGVLWQISRGCDFGCDYCFDSQGMKGIRRFPMERVRAELDLFVRKRVGQVAVIDSTFNQDVQRAKEILRLIARRAPHIHFHFEVRSEFIDMEMARLFARINCSLQLGLQSAHPQVNKAVRRVFNPADFSAKVAMLNETGAVFGFDLIYGLPSDSLQGFRASIDFALGLYPNHVDIFPLAVLPGTPLASQAGNLRLRSLKTPPYTLQSSPDFPGGAMGEAAGLALACDIFYSRGKAVAWFNTLLLPLGLSPAAFLGRFRSWIIEEMGDVKSEAEVSDEQVREAQRGFITRLYTGKRLRKLLPVALDLIDYNWHYAAALMASPPELPTDRELERASLLDERFELAPSARLARFNYEVFDLLQAGEIDLADFVECFRPTVSHAVIYPRGGEVFTESLIKAHYEFLSRLDGTQPPRRLAASLHIPPEEAVSFLEFAAAEGIIRRSGDY
ncbi:MAG TPA: cobalamin-dependent protein [Geobacteraceae bacterium]|nr:cobalamin-dependent protein [Geobacteraceae bacterium]